MICDANGGGKFLVMMMACVLYVSCDDVRAMIMSGHVDDFQDGSVQHWTGSPTANVADAGPSGLGDHALRVDSDNRVVTFNQTQWTGDWMAAGVKQITLDVRHNNNFDLKLWLGIANGVFGPGGSGDTYVTNQSVVVSPDDAWHTVMFDVEASDFGAAPANSSGAPNPAAALVNVTHFRIIHNPNPDFIGATGGGNVLLDNIGAVIPEPGSLAALALSGLILVHRRR